MSLSNRDWVQAAIGSLLTLPEYAQSTRELAIAAQHVAALEADLSVSRDRNAILELLAPIFVDSPDQMPNPFTDLLVTPRASAIARCDFLDDPVRDAQLAIATAHAAGAGSAVAEVTDAVLGLMRMLGQRCGWERYQEPGGEFGHVRSVPDQADLLRLNRRVIFDEEALETACGSSWHDALRPLVLDRPASPEGHELRTQPLVECAGTGLVVARPEALAGALAFTSLKLAFELDGGKRVVEAFSTMGAYRAMSSLAQLGVTRARPAPDTGWPHAHSSSVLFLDVDSILHLVVLAPDLTLGVVHGGHLWRPPFREDIPPHLDDVEARLRDEAPHLETVVHLVVIEGAGAQPMLHFNRPSDIKSPHIVLTGSELEWLARHPDTDPREFAAFAHDLTSLRTRHQVLAASELDAFALWRDRALGFSALEATASDSFDRVILAAGGARDLRMEVVRRYAPTVAPAPDGDGEWQVARFLEYDDVELWAPWGAHDSPAHFFVPGIGRGVWVLDDVDDPSQESPGWDYRRKLTELLAYWLWRLSDQLVGLRRWAESTSQIPLVRVQVQSEEAGDSQVPYEIATIGEGVVGITVHAGIEDELGSQAATPEHSLVQKVVDALCESAGIAEPDLLTFPVGLRKLTYMSSANPALRNVPLPLATVHPSFRTRVHRKLGDDLMRRLSLPIGPIERDRCNDVLHSAVMVLYEDLGRQLEQWPSELAVSILIGLYERLLHNRAVADIELALIHQFFGHHQEASAARIEVFRRESEAAVACRFVIELAAANPPQGDKPISDHAIQELLATSVSLISLAHVSDAIHFDLGGEAATAIVPPGLFMASAPGFVAAHGAFSAAVRTGDIERSQAHAAALLDADTPDDEDADLLDAINKGHLLDHGCSVRNLIQVLAALSRVPEHIPGCSRLSEKALHALARESLDEPDREAQVVALLTMGPREDFLKPPRPYSRNDVLPWRFNRALSYLRRPLIRMPESAGEHHYLFGAGACFGAAQFLGDLMRTARLGFEGSHVRAAAIEMQRRLSRRFEDEVAEAVEAHSAWRVRRRVRKLAGTKLARPDGQDLGDIDVLAGNPRESLIICLEVKALAGALAPHQLRREIDANFAGPGSGQSAATRLVERAEFVAEHVDEALSHLGIEGRRDGWAVLASVVTDYENLSALLDTCPVPVLTMRELRLHVAADTLAATLAS